MADREPKETREYKDVGVFQRLTRRTAATRPMTWLYIRIQRRLDQFVYRLTNGRTTPTSWLSGLPVIMLTTTGAKSGQQRTVPVLGFREGDRVVVIASNYGQSSYPSWYHNLRAHPEATVTADRKTYGVEARELTGREYDEWFERTTEMYPGFVVYRDRASHRRIPVLTLDPA